MFSGNYDECAHHDFGWIPHNKSTTSTATAEIKCNHSIVLTTTGFFDGEIFFVGENEGKLTR